LPPINRSIPARKTRNIVFIMLMYLANFIGALFRVVCRKMTLPTN
jgi:hypothetical protein